MYEWHKGFLKSFFLACFIYTNINLSADNSIYNTYNNHGVIGLINMPSARVYDEGFFGITLYDGTPDQKITMTASPYDWLEASFFYTNIQGMPYPGYEYQDNKDKGFNFKVRLKKEGKLPALAIGINDIAGTGLFGSEYIVASYGVGNLDMHLGLAWGALNGSNNSFKNPLIYLDKRFENRPVFGKGAGGQFQPSRYFSDQEVSPFFGLSYVAYNKFLIKIENDTTATDGLIEYDEPSKRISASLEYILNDNINVGIARERDNYISFRITYKKNASPSKKPYKYKKPIREDEDKYGFFIKSLETNGIGVNKIIEGADNIGLEISQFSHPSLNIIEDIIYTAKKESGIKKDLKTNYKVADLSAYSEYDESLNQKTNLIYQRELTRRFNSNTRFNIRPYIASREGFFKFAFLLENNNEYIIKDNFFFSSNLKYSIKDNFNDLVLPPDNTFPAQVRSDIKEYLRNFNNRIIIGRAQFDYHLSPKKNNHLMISAGILEEMFNGYGLEYLYFDNSKNYSLGFEIFNVKKRDYKLRFGTIDYKTTTGFLNFHYRNQYIVPFDAKISYGKFLAGDMGSTFELSRSYANGAKFGLFASFTDVNSEQFGEGSFDKGIFFNIPIYKNLVNYTWRPLTKDPGAKLIRKHNLHDLLVKFRPYKS